MIQPANHNIPSHSCDEAEVVQQIQQGDPAGFEFIVRKYGGYLLSVARQYLNSQADAEDAVQETYLQAFNNINTFRAEASLKSWLHKITINNALMKIRKEAKTETLISREDIDAGTFDENGKRRKNENEISITADEAHNNAELRDTIRQHIMLLPTDHRNIILLRDIEGYSISETAQLLEISEASVKTRLHRARNLLKTQLEKM